MTTQEALRAEGVEVVLPGGRRILGPVSLTVAPGSLTAVLGPSGSGKTTLLRTMAGVADPTGGTVRLGDRPAEERVEDLGYVPQRETVHGRLTVEEAVRYAATLRLARDTDLGPLVREVLEELDLVEQAGTPIRDLSGGERRRAACATELVGRPQVLLLDEPTSGLDPVLERRLMLMLRRLADQGRAVVLITHATASLHLCDRVAVLAQGGTLAVDGAPAEALQHLERVAAAADAAAATAAPPEETAPHPAATTRPFGVELRALVGRYARTLLRDRRTLLAQLLQAPIIGLVIGLLFESGALGRTGGQNPVDAANVAFLTMTGAIWLGVTAACREVVKERAIIERELDVGLRMDAYVLSKAVVLFALTAVEVLLLVAVVATLQPLGVPVDGAVVFLVLAIAVAWTSVAMGLAVSVVARSVDQAASVVPLLLVPQLVFAGAIVPLQRMPQVVEVLAQVTYARWAYAGMGSALDLETRLGGASGVAAAIGLGRGFFSLPVGASLTALVAFTLLLLITATVLLTRRAVADD